MNVFSIATGKDDQTSQNATANLAFPRLGIWWPNPETQPIQDIARYDWVILTNDSACYLKQLRELNSDILILNSTNASELHYDPDDSYNSAENSLIRKIPSQWFITQVGANLTKTVNATTNEFYVSRVSATNSSGTYDLFRAGDTALIEGESVYIQAVDVSLKKLTVRRGYIRPAATHSAGTRIAAHAYHWSKTWLLNLTIDCPKAIVDSTYGPETWYNFNARRSSDYFSSADWDGLLVDRNEHYQSWIIDGDKVRTIDPDQSNTLLSNYAAFDAAWKQGAMTFLEHLRDAMGTEKILVTNWGVPYYSVLNGNNFEAFPSDSGTAYGTSWRETMMGKILKGSYFDWMTYSGAPNLSMILTYDQDEGRGYYCSAGFTPNYQKMRFGLTTALLNNGFFSYEMGSNGHGELCLMWFDEYDNAGKKRGYLGKPIGPAYKAIPDENKNQLISNRDFENDLSPWKLDVYKDHVASLSIDKTNPGAGSQSAKVTISKTDGDYWEVAMYYASPVSITEDVIYSLQFKARSDTQRTIKIYIKKNTSNEETLIWYGDFSLTTEWKSYEIELEASDSYNDGTIYFALGEKIGLCWFDDIALIKGSDQVWRRDFQNGIVLVNATKEPCTIPLNRTYQHINGNQVHSINTGEFTDQVQLSPLDGRILLGRNVKMLPFLLPLIGQSSK